MTLRQTQAILHTWSGLLVGWALYTIFLAGTVSFWRDEISRWTRPMLGPDIDRALVLDRAQAFLDRKAPHAKSWTIELPGERGAGTLLSWQAQPKEGEKPGRRRRGAGNEQWLDGQGMPVSVPDTRGGDFFYRLHFDLHYVPVLWARWLVGFCAMMMLVAIVSGVITHKKIFKDFFTFRPGPGQRNWLDGHNATAVLALPFHLMITYTGLITLMTLYMPWGVAANYPNRDAFYKDLLPAAQVVRRSDEAEPLADLKAMVAQAERRWGDGHAATIRIAQPGDRAARVQILRRLSDRIVDGGQAIGFDGVTGELRTGPAAQSGGAVTRDAMIGLHAGRFAPMTMRWLYFLCSLAGTVMVATGLVLWTVKRREKLADRAQAHIGIRLIERLNVGFIAGLPVAMTGFLWANRLIEPAMKGRADREVLAMFLLWAGCLVVGLVCPPRKGWTILFSAGSILLAGLALFDMVATRTGLVANLLRGDSAMAGMEGGFILLAVALGWLARKVARHVPAGKRSRPAATAGGIAVPAR